MTPLEVMLDNMRRFFEAARALEEAGGEDAAAEAAALREKAERCAERAAPYCHARLASRAADEAEAGPVRFVISAAPETETTEQWQRRRGKSGRPSRDRSTS